MCSDVTLMLTRAFFGGFLDGSIHVKALEKLFPAVKPGVKELAGLHNLSRL